MDFTVDPAAAELLPQLQRFLSERILPAERTLAEQLASDADPYAHPPILQQLKQEARSLGLWNLFFPHRTASSPGLSNVAYAPLAELSGHSHLAPEVLNCAAPDSGNMELLARFGTPRPAGPLAYAAA